MKMKMKYLLFGALLYSSNAHGIVALLRTDQYSTILGHNVTQAIEAANQVAHLQTQIEQFTEQITLSEITNDILGEYVGFDVENQIGEVLESYENLSEVADISSMLDSISVEDIFTNTANGAFAEIEAPEEVDEARYQSHATVESAYQSAVETQQRTTEANVELATEAREQRERAANATSEAEYTVAVDNAEAAEAAIDRNNQEALMAANNARAVKAAADMQELKAEKAALDLALEEERASAEESEEAFLNQEFIIN